ncbi:MAG TPA: hypothetical protein VLM40_23315, partial [Gemmata sp.]|nr:hypothetical protein [Gemmata sp.]
MLRSFDLHRYLVVAFSLCALLSVANADDPVTLTEKFSPDHLSKVEVAVRLSGRLALPAQKGKSPEVVTLVGASRLRYEERILSLEKGKIATVRAYRDVEFKRTVAGNTQDAGIRPSVRRMVVIKNEGRRAPFSPDGPLTWGEIDVVRTDVFNPAAIPGLLPNGAVKKGDTWKASESAVGELTDLEKIDEGGITVELVGMIAIDGKRVARLKLSGTVRGVNQDGPSRQKLDGTGYFDLDAGVFTYLSLKGTHDLLDGKGETVGRIEGQFTMTRSRLEQAPADLSDASLRGLELKPTLENTLLLYDDDQLGVHFLYPRGWRVGAVQGKQVTLDHARGAGILLTVEPAARVPAAEDYAKEVAAFLKKQEAEITATEKPTRVREL